MKPVRTLCLLLAAFALVTGCGKTPENSPPPASGQAAEQLRFTAKTVDDQDFSGESLAGKPAVLWFWAPWCPSCQAEAPTVAKLAKSSSGVTFVGVAAQDKLPAMKEFVTKYDMGGFTHLADLDASVWARFGVTAQPAFAFIDKDGKVEVVIGSPTEEALVTRIAHLAA
jgi:thiol-disulfide isomerase/thioredoxin